MVSQVHPPLVNETMGNTTSPSNHSSSMPSPSFTLSLGGVDFRLVPTEDINRDHNDSPMLSLVGNNNTDGNEMVMNLSSFTGTLRVSLSKYNRNDDSTVAMTTTSADDKVTPAAANTTMVEESPSPVKFTTLKNEPHDVSPRQKTLPFTKASESNKHEMRTNKTDDPTPDVVPPSTGRSTKQKNRKHTKRTVPEIATNPIPSPPRQMKKTRRSNTATTPTRTDAELNKPPTLGQATQLSQSDDTQQSSNMSSQDNETVTKPTTATADAALPSSTLVRELVRQATEAFSESVTGDCTHDDHDDDDDDDDDHDHTLRFGSTQHDNNTDNNNNNDDDNAIMEIDDNGNTMTSAADTATLVAATTMTPKRHGQPPPSPRWGHTMTQLDGDRILVYGGQNINSTTGKTETLSDIHVYDKHKRIWYKPVNCEGVPRQWHTSSFLPERQLLISFGGESFNAKTGRAQTTDQVMVLDTDIMLWYPPTVSGTVPSGRSGHTATLFPNTNELVVFGGVRGSKWQNSVAVLDIASWKWSAPKAVGSAPRPRSYHSATALLGGGNNSNNQQPQRNRLVIFGGNNRDSSFDTIHVLESDGKKWSWSHPSASGDAPKPRSGHSATLLDDKKTILIYGGWDLNADVEEGASDDEMIFSDSYLLDTDTWKWTKGSKPVFAGDGSSVDLTDSLAKDGGHKRVGHKAVLSNGENGPEVMVFGGRVLNDKFANDFQTLSVPSSTPIGFTAS